MSYNHVLCVDSAVYSDFSETCCLLSDDMLPNANLKEGDIIQIRLHNQNTKGISVPAYRIKIINIKQDTRTLFTTERIEDFTVLESLLSSKEWEGANAETIRLINEIISEHEEIKSFSYSELKKLLLPENSQSREKIREINRLWVEYSNGIFGFSVQKDIYAQEGGEIKDNPFNEKVWKNFLREIDWASLTSSFTLLQPQFSLDGRTEKGHLPYWYKWNQDELREDLHNSSEESILVKELGFLVLFYIVESIFD